MLETAFIYLGNSNNSVKTLFFLCFCCFEALYLVFPTYIILSYSRGEARGLANCRKGYMFVAHSKILQNAITKLALSKPNKLDKENQVLI